MKWISIRKHKLVQAVQTPLGVKVGSIEYAEEYDAVIAELDLITAMGIVGGLVRHVPPEALHFLFESLDLSKLYDLSAHGRHGSCTNVSLVQGKLYFKGYNAYVTADPLQFSKVTVKVVYDTDVFGGRRVLLSNLDADAGWELRFSDENVSWFLRSTDGEEEITSAAKPGRHVLKATWDGSEAALWMDGTKVASSTNFTGDISAVSTCFRIGAESETTPPAVGFYEGYIEEAMVYNAVPESDESLQLWWKPFSECKIKAGAKVTGKYIRTHEPFWISWNAVIDQVKYVNRVAHVKILRHLSKQVRQW